MIMENKSMAKFKVFLTRRIPQPAIDKERRDNRRSERKRRINLSIN